MTGGHHVTVTADVASPRAGDLVRAIETIEPIVVHMGEEALGASMSPIRWVICEDFAAEVAAHLDPTGGNTYSGDRVGGEVAAKTMVDPDHGGYAVYLNGPQLCDSDEPQSELSLMFLVAHEADHVLQYDTRRISGVADNGTAGGMVRRAARFIGHFAVDEYRADAVAFAILAQVASVTDSTTGISRSAGPQDTFALDHLAGFEAAVLGMYPMLADTVDDYRNHRISLDALLEIVIPYTDQFVTLAAHWQALCDCLSIAEPWSLGDLPDAPATHMYARPLWGRLNDLLDGRLLIPRPGVIADYDREFAAISEEAVLDFWGKLGITIEDMSNSDEYIHVAAPSRNL